MKISGFRKVLIVTGLIAAIVIAGTACDTKKIYSDPEMTATSAMQYKSDPLDYSYVDAKMREYNFGLNEYMKEHLSESTQKISSGTTPGGVPAQCKYTISPDSKYEALQMEKDIGTGIQVDEYFNMGFAMYITRTTIYNDGNYDPVDKYYIYENVLYKIDASAKSVTKIADLSDASAEEAKANIDIYLSFEEIRALYA